MKYNGVSIIICCYNSERLIKPTLEHCLNQNGLEDLSYEIIVVDNNSKDLTQYIVKDISFHSKIPVKILEEPKIGLSHARFCGIKNSHYDLVLFCDDDNWLNLNYVYNSFQFLTDNLDYGIVGGNGIEKCEIVPPKWFERFKSIYAIGCRFDGEVSNVYGAGMCIVKNYIYDFIPNLTDRKGTNLMSGGDSEMCDFVKKRGFKIAQLCSNTFNHFIPKNRLTLEYLYKTASGRGRSLAFLKLLRANNSKYQVWSLYRLRRDLLILFQSLLKCDLIAFRFNLSRIWAYWKVSLSRKF